MSVDEGLPPRKVAICGTAPSSIGLAPHTDPTWEIWGTSRLWAQVPRWNVWFELHDLDTIGKGWDCGEEQRKAQRKQHLDWMAAQSGPIYLQKEDPRIPSGIKYPLDEILAYFAHHLNAPEKYLTNHISYMLALAIYEGVDEVGIYGVDMALNEEYMYQRPSVEYLVGIARGQGIKVHLPDECDILKALHLYGYEDNDPFSAKVRARQRELKDRKAAHRQGRIEAQIQRAELVGAANLAKELAGKPDEEVPASTRQGLARYAEQWEQAAAVLQQNVQQMNADIAGLSGALDNMGYIERSWM